MRGWIALLVVPCGCGGLRIDSVSSPISPGGLVEIAGAGFGDGLRLAFAGPGLQIQLQSIAVGDSTTATAIVPASTPPGTYALVATQGGATATFQGVRVLSTGLTVHFIDVGQGDATLVIAPTGEALLIDGGPRDAGPVVRDAVRDLANGRLDAVVLSHTDADHLGGLVELLQGDDGQSGTGDDVVPELRFGGVDDGGCTSQVCRDMRALRAYPFTVPDVGFAIPLGDVEARIVAVDGDVGGGRILGVDNENERSVVVRLGFAGRSVLILGDLTGGGDGEANVELPLANATGPVDVLRIGHHGSSTSSNAQALAAWQPRAIVVSVGTDNAYCHPAAEVVARLDDLGAPIFATGAGIVDDAARCGGATDWPGRAQVGLGTLTLTIDVDGSITLAGTPL